LFPQIETAMYILLSNYFQQTKLTGKGWSAIFQTC